MYYNPQLAGATPRTLRLLWNITGAVTVAPLIPGLPVLTAFSAPSAQSVIDDFLGTTSEFLLAAFDATALGADVMGGVVDMGGQCQKVIGMVARCYSASNTLVTRQCQASSALTASTLATEVAKGANGNIAFRVDFGNSPDFDNLTAGTIEIEILWLPK